MALAPEYPDATKGPSMIFRIDIPWNMEMIPGLTTNNGWLPGNFYFARKGKAKWKHKRKFSK
jgi:hypothetical protein